MILKAYLIKKNVDHPKLLFKKKTKNMKNARSITTIGRAKKGVLISVFLIEEMFNDIWPIYNALEKKKN